MVPQHDSAPAKRFAVFWRPRSPYLWAYLIAFTVGLALWGKVFLSGVGARDWTIAVVWAVVLGVLIVLLTRRLDLFGGAHASLLVAAFLWGAVPAISFAVRINDALVGQFDRRMVGYQAWDAAAVAPLVEETLKGVGIVIVVLIGRQYVVRPFHGAVIGAMCGLGFQLVEDINYVQHAATGALGSAISDEAGVIETVVLRTIFALSTHWLLSGIVGLGIGYALLRRDRTVTRRAAAFLSAYLCAAVLHFVIDSPMPDSQSAAQAAALAKALGILLVGYVIYRFAIRAEWRTFARVAAMESDDVVGAADVNALRTHRKRRAAYRQVRRLSGETAASSVRDAQNAQLRLVNTVLAGGDTQAERENVRRCQSLSSGRAVADSRAT